jgi:hypothetical protein
MHQIWRISILGKYEKSAIVTEKLFFQTYPSGAGSTMLQEQTGQHLPNLKLEILI